MSLENPNVGKLVQLLWELYYYAVFLSITGCLTGSLDKGKYMAAIPLYLETGIQKTCPTKPFPAQLKLNACPYGLCVSLLLTYVNPRTVCIKPLRHYAISGTLYVTPAASAWMTQFPWPLRCLCWARVAWTGCCFRSLCFYIGLSILSLPRTHCPSLLFTDSTLLSNPALAKWMTDHSGAFSNWPSNSSYTFPIGPSKVEIKSLINN